MIPSFEPDQNLGVFQGLRLQNDSEGNLLVNAVEAEEFDSRIALDVEGLLFLGRLTTNFNLYGHNIVLQTLTRGERLAITQHIKDYEESLGLLDALQTGYLALSIVSLDNQPLSLAMAPEHNTPLAKLERNFQIVGSWYDPICEAIYSEYTRLLVRQQTAFQELDLKLMAGRAKP